MKRRRIETLTRLGQHHRRIANVSQAHESDGGRQTLADPNSQQQRWQSTIPACRRFGLGRGCCSRRLSGPVHG